MRLKFKDILWFLVILGIGLILIIKPSRDAFIETTSEFPYLMGFIKVAILATMGELLAARIVTQKYYVKGIILKFIIWGLIGCSFVLVFKIFAAGVGVAQASHLLPFVSHPAFFKSLLFAFLTSTIINIIFAPTFMAFHRISDTFIELGEGNLNKIRKTKLDDVINTIDWNYFIKFIVLKTIPFFWIPAHTITFLLPEEYQVLMAAILSIALGIILSLSKKKNMK